MLFLKKGFIFIFICFRVGNQLERTLGARRIIPVYLISGIAGNIASAIFVPKQVTVYFIKSFF